MTIQLYMVEDHPVMRETLQDFVALTDDVEVCGVAADADAAETALESIRPDVLLVDVALPGRSGLDLLEQILDRVPVPAVVLSGHRERTYVDRAFAAGASGYVLKGRPAEVLVAIRRAAEGGRYLSPGLEWSTEVTSPT